MGSFGPLHWLVVMVVAALLFGNKFPQLGRSLGKGIVEFKKGLKGLEEDLDDRPVVRQDTAALEPPRPPQRVQTPATPRFEENSSSPAPQA